MEVPKKGEQLQLREFLGFKFISRVRLSESVIKIPSEFLPINHPSICVFGKNQDLPNGILSLFERSKWYEIVTKLITMCFYNLAVAGKIKIHIYNDEKTYLQLYKLRIRSIRFSLVSDKPSSDFFENEILIQLAKNKELGKLHLNAEYIIRDVLSNCIGSDRMSRPAKTFMEHVLERNSQIFDWFDLANNYGFFVIKNLFIEIDPKQKLVLKDEYVLLKKQYRKHLKESREFRLFHEELEDHILSDFHDRVPSGD